MNFTIPEANNDLTKFYFENERNKKVCVTELIHDLFDVSKKTPSSLNNIMFCFRVIMKTLDSLLSEKYSDFDAQTTSNCCHGIAALVRELISSFTRIELENIRNECKEKLNSLENTIDFDEQEIFSWQIPIPLVDLAGLYILSFIKEIDPQKGYRTFSKKLKTISPVGTQFCTKIVRNLQKQFSNTVAKRYHLYLEKIEKGMLISGIPVEIWGRYIKPEYLRIDKFGVLYASNMFSMQVLLAYLILCKAKLALVSDFMSIDGTLKKRQIYIFEGDGHGQLKPLTHQQIKNLNTSSAEPIIIFGGCVYTDNLDFESLAKQMKPWLNQISRLILACDIFYPQFPNVIDDPEFSSLPIFPDEKCIQQEISSLSLVQGVSASDPSFFCLAHIYTASVGQVLSEYIQNSETILPPSFIPSVKLAFVGIK